MSLIVMLVPLILVVKPGVKPKPLDPRLVAVIFEQVRKMAEKDQPKSLRRLALRCNYEFVSYIQMNASFLGVLNC